MAQSTYVLVEDNDFDRARLKQTVLSEDPNAMIVEFDCLTGARDYFASGNADFILLDNNLPDGKGADYARELGENARLCDVPIIMVSDDHSLKYHDIVKGERGAALIGKDDLSKQSLSQVISNFLTKEMKSGTSSEMADAHGVLELFSKQVGEQMLAPLSRALRLARSAKSDSNAIHNKALSDTLTRLEATLIASRDYADTLAGNKNGPDN